MTLSELIRARHIGLLALGAAVGYFAHTARAGGIPASRTLTYAGTLHDADGNPLTGSRAIDFRLFDQEKAGAVQCEVLNPTGDVQVEKSGRFAIPLTDDCATAVRLHPALWVELRVGGSKLPRVPLGAVPYAIEAQHATVADTVNEKSRTIAGVFPYGSRTEDDCVVTDKPEWQDVRDMFVDVNVDAPVTIWATYSINVEPSGDTTAGAWLATHLVVDGVEAPSSASHFQPHSTADANMNVSGQHVGELAAGPHKVRVQWATGGPGVVGWASCSWKNYETATGGRSLTVLAVYK